MLPPLEAPPRARTGAVTRKRAERVERQLARHLKLGDSLRHLHAEPTVLREQRHGVRYGAHRVGKKGARVRVGYDARAALL